MQRSTGNRIYSCILFPFNFSTGVPIFDYLFFSAMDVGENAYKLFKVLFYQNIILITIVGAIQLFSSV